MNNDIYVYIYIVNVDKVYTDSIHITSLVSEAKKVKAVQEVILKTLFIYIYICIYIYSSEINQKKVYIYTWHELMETLFKQCRIWPRVDKHVYMYMWVFVVSLCVYIIYCVYIYIIFYI